MALTPKSSVVPPGGFHFVEKHDGIEIKIESTSYEAVAAALTRYRVNNGLPVGKPLEEVTEFVCSQWPHFCHDTGEFNMLVPRQPNPDEPLSRRLTYWITLLWRTGAGNEVKQQEADRRAVICKACPHNVDFRTGGCSSCIDGIDRLAFTWLKNRKTPSDTELRACQITGALNRCAVQAKTIPAMTPEEAAQLPEPCWRKA